MPSYFYSGTTQQNGVVHSNIIVAMKVDPSGDPKFDILDQTTADVNGNFVLQWNDWAGRVIIGAIDDDDVVKLQCIFHDFLAGDLNTDIFITHAPVFTIIQDTDGISLTQAPVYVIKSLQFDISSPPPSSPSFDLNNEV